MSNFGGVSEKYVLVAYEISPVPIEHEDELYRLMLDEVWGDERMADEDIRLEAEFDTPDMISVVRYQFPAVEEAAEKSGRISWLIRDAMEIWHNKVEIAA